MFFYSIFFFFFSLLWLLTSNKSIKNIKKIGLFSSLIIFFWANLLWIFFDPYQMTFQYLYSIRFFSMFFYFGIDGISLLFIYLTSFLIPCCILFNWNNTYHFIKEYILCLLSLEIVLISVFCVLDIILFYVFFESILIPTFIFIGIWGSRQRKIHAAYLLFFYTLFGSLLMLFSILILYSHSGTTDFQILWGTELSNIREKLLWLAFFFSFAIKIPMFPFHIWLPEAHVEAPTEGSVLLAGVLLKLGGYGFMRILIPIFFNANIYFLPFVFLLASIGILYTSFTTLCQIDLKRIIAYSSIAHMNIAVLGLFTLDLISSAGSVLLLLSHGIVSGGLFFMIGMLYDRYKTRLLKYYSGLVHLMPLFGTFFLLLILGNISLPGTSSFVGEFLIFCGLVTKSKWAFFISCIGVLLCTIYSIWLYNRIVFGLPRYEYYKNLFDLNRLEFNLISPFIVTMILIGIFPKPILSSLAGSLFFLLSL
jgi:proton-translocating NADH-quinone oxidoreductase chain M